MLQIVTPILTKTISSLAKKNTFIFVVILIAVVCIYMGWHHYFIDRLKKEFGIQTSPSFKFDDQGHVVSWLKDKVQLGNDHCPDRFDLRGTYIAKFVSCYDGDTCDVVIMLPNKDANSSQKFKAARFRVRTKGYNAPEIKQPKDEPNRDQYKDLAVQSRDMLWNLVSGLKSTASTEHNRLVAVDCHGFDKYGRLLVEVFPVHVHPQTKKVTVDRTVSINKTMLAWLGPEYEMDDKGRMVFNQMPEKSSG